MTFKIHPILIAALVIGVIVILISLFRGCKNNKHNSELAVSYKTRIDNLIQDSIESSKKLAEYVEKNEMLDGQISLSNNKLLFLDENLGKANDRITVLLNKHVPIKPSLDTNVTTVPNVYIDDCADCFKELGDGQKLVVQYKAEKENQFNLLSGKINLKDNRIRDLETANVKLTSNYRNLIDSSKKFQDKYKPHGRLYLSWGVLFAPWPTAAGAGFMYQNKRNILYGAKWYYRERGHMVETNLNFPLSLRFK